MSIQTHHTLHCLLGYGISTDLQNSYNVVNVAWVVRVVNIASYHFVNSSAKRLVCEGSSYCKIFLIHAMYGKILKFPL